MIPSFEPPIAANMVRDGGSLAMSFESDGNCFWLFFRLLKDKTPRRLGYESPVVQNRTLGTEEPISWEDAASWLEQGLQKMSEERHKKWARIMLKVTDSRGQLPEEISPTFG